MDPRVLVAVEEFDPGVYEDALGGDPAGGDGCSPADSGGDSHHRPDCAWAAAELITAPGASPPATVPWEVTSTPSIVTVPAPARTSMRPNHTRTRLAGWVG